MWEDFAKGTAIGVGGGASVVAILAWLFKTFPDYFLRKKDSRDKFADLLIRGSEGVVTTLTKENERKEKVIRELIALRADCEVKLSALTARVSALETMYRHPRE